MAGTVIKCIDSSNVDECTSNIVIECIQFGHSLLAREDVRRVCKLNSCQVTLASVEDSPGLQILQNFYHIGLLGEPTINEDRVVWFPR